MTIEQQVAQLFVWGFEGYEATAPLKRLLKKYHPGGLILFRRNIHDPEQVQHLTAELQRAGRSHGAPLLMGIDQEGGRVARLHWFAEYPPAAVYGKIYQRQKGVHFIEAVARLMAWELKNVGVNLNFAPVLDVNSNPKNPIIGDRAFSHDAHVVAKTAVPFFRGLLSEGVIPCGKHFPGHGDTKTDSHLELPRVEVSRESWRRVSLVPFREAIRQGIPTLMTAHIICQNLDPDRPATLSRKIIHDLLREELGFSGVLFTDDLFMKALAKYSLIESMVLALEAGNDAFLVCKEFETRYELMEQLGAEVQKSPSLKRRVEESVARIALLKKKYLKNQ